MPFPNEHSARMKNPGQFVRFARQSNELGNGIDVIFGINEDGKSEIQAIRFDVKQFTATEARKWLRDHDFNPILFEEATGVTAEMNDLENQIRALGEANLEIEIEAAHAGIKKPATFKMVAYGGNAIMQPKVSYLPIIINTETVIIASYSLPILKNHETEVAHSTRIFVQNGEILAEGIFSIVSKETDDLVASAKNGFPWQASIRGPFPKDKMEIIKAGETRTVNNKLFSGPALIVNNLRLTEISILAMGADDQTSVNVAAKAVQFNKSSKEELNMTKEEIEAKKLKEEKEDNDKLKKDEELKAAEAKKQEEIKAAALKANELKTAEEIQIETHIKAQREALAKDARHLIKVKKLCGDNMEIYAQSLENNWDLNKTELEVIKASRTQTFNIGSGMNERQNSIKSIEIAACMSLGVKADNLAKVYKPEEVEAAAKLRGIGLQQIFEMVCKAESVAIPMRFCNETIRAAFTTLALPGIFSNALNKILLQQYEAFPSASLDVSMQSDVQDFKETKSFRLVGTGDLLKVAGDGELKSGVLDEDTFTNQIDTFGRLLWLTRQDIINDDLNAFSQLPRMMGRKGAQLRETLFWDVVKNGEATSFFDAAPASPARKNFFSGATSALSITSLSTAEAIAAEQVDKLGNPVNITMKKLVVPPALRTTAETLMTATTVNDGTLEPTPNNNPHTGKFDVVTTPFLALSSGGVTGSDKAWYLAAEGEDVAAWDTAFLRGQRVPTVETGETSFEKLGIAWRVFFDIGVAEQDRRAAVKSKGEA